MRRVINLRSATIPFIFFGHGFSAVVFPGVIGQHKKLSHVALQYPKHKNRYFPIHFLFFYNVLKLNNV